MAMEWRGSTKAEEDPDDGVSPFTTSIWKLKTEAQDRLLVWESQVAFTLTDLDWWRIMYLFIRQSTFVFAIVKIHPFRMAILICMYVFCTR